MHRNTSTLFAGLLLAGALIAPPLLAQTPTVRYAFAGSASDLSGNGRTGTLLGGTAYAGGSQLVFGNNAVDNLQIPNTAADGLTDFTVTAVVRFNTIHNASSAGLNPILSGANPTNPATTDNALLLTLGAGVSAWRMQINSNDYRFAYGGVTPVAGTWYHVAFVRSGSIGRCYINGVAKNNTVSGTPDAVVSNAPLLISAGGLLAAQEQDFTGSFAPNIVGGGFQATQSLAGNLGELTIYNGALSSTQIQELARNTWTGDVSTDWANANNWGMLRPPLASDDPLVPAAPANQPTISAAGATGNRLTLDAGSVLTQTVVGTLDLKANLINNSNSSSFAGLTSFTGGSPQQVSGDGASAFTNLTVGASGLTDASTNGISVSRLMTLNGNFQSGTTPVLLHSSAAGTAMVVNSGGAITNSARIERYIDPSSNAAKGYRQISSPVQSTTFNDLNVTGQYTVKTSVAYNTNPNQPLSKFPNIFRYRESRVTADNFDLGWESPTSAADPMLVGRGYSAYTLPLTHDFVGVPNTGTLAAVACTNTGGFANSGWSLLGNPYPSPIDWDLVISNGLVPAGMTNGVSVFRSEGINTGTYMVYNNGVGDLPNGEIASAQGFFVRVPNPGSVNFTFTNAMRPTAYANPMHYRQAPDARPTLTLALRSVSPNVTDQATVYFEEGATAGFDAAFDAAKPGASLCDAPTLNWLTPDGEAVALNALAPAVLAGAGGLQLPLHVQVNVPGEHELTIGALRYLAVDLPVWLLDGATGAVVDLRAGQPYRFQLDPAFRGARFSVQLGGARPTANSHPALTRATLAAYPNPTDGATRLTVAVRDLPAEAELVQATLVDNLGRVVTSRALPVTAGSVATTWATAGLVPGLYSLRVSAAGVPTVVERVVVR